MNEPIIPSEHGDSQPQPEPEESSSATPVTSASEPTTKPELSPHSKLCSLCQQPRDVLIRCQIDATKKWNFICPGKCWHEVSGGKVDGGGEYPYYRYGGMWKNKHVYVSAKIKGKAKEENKMRSGEVKSMYHRRPGWKEKVFKSEKDLPGVKGKAGVVAGVDDRVFDEDVSDFDEEEEQEELEGMRSHMIMGNMVVNDIKDD